MVVFRFDQQIQNFLGCTPFLRQQRHALVIFYSIVHDSNGFVQVIRTHQRVDFLFMPSSPVLGRCLNWFQHFHKKEKVVVSCLHCGLHLASARWSQDDILILYIFHAFQDQACACLTWTTGTRKISNFGGAQQRCVLPIRYGAFLQICCGEFQQH